VSHIEKRGPKKYRARYRDPLTGKERSHTFDREGDAKKFLTTVDGSKQTGSYIDPQRARVTIGAWATEWRNGRVHLKPSTLASYDSLLTTCVLPKWETVPLARVTNSAITTWVAALRADGLSASRVRQAYHLFSSMLDAAVRDRRIATNPAAGTKLPRLPSKARRYLDHNQLADLAHECGPHETLVLLLGYSGLRWGEAAALRVKHIDTMRGRLDITEAMTEVNGRIVFGTPKSHQTRSVPVPAFLRDRLAQQIAGKGPEDLAFPAARGGVLRVGSFRRGWFNAAATAVGLDGLVPHELRHTAASIAIASGASVKGVQAMLGHASATLTLDRYGHLFGDTLDAVAERIDAAARAATANVARPNRGLAVVPLTAEGTR
jgi:integrase